MRYVYVDPDRPAPNGAVAVAIPATGQQAAFRRYSEEGGRRYLHALNPQFPPLETGKGFATCGVVPGCFAPV